MINFWKWHSLIYRTVFSSSLIEYAGAHIKQYNNLALARTRGNSFSPRPLLLMTDNLKWWLERISGSPQPIRIDEPNMSINRDTSLESCGTHQDVVNVEGGGRQMR